MKRSTIITLVFCSVLLLFGVVGCSWAVGVNNREVELRNTFTAKISERTAGYDKLWKTLNQKAQVTLRNDTAFQNIVNIQMTGQKDGEQVTWKWIQQSNPSATFTEVSALYKDLSRAIEAGRNEFFERERVLADVKLQHDNIRKKWPASMVVGKRKELVYKPITSLRTDGVMATGQDNDTKIF